jgi:uncharacterized Tic20 family protein
MNHEERTLAALSNLGVFVPLVGLVGVFGLFLSQKAKNERLQFYALQSIIVQIAELVFLMLMVVLYLFAVFGSLLFITFFPKTGQPLLGAFLPIGVSVLTFLGLLAFFLAGGVAAVTIFSGREFEYPAVAGFLKRYLTPGQEENTEKASQ